LRISSSRAANERKLHERLIEGWAKDRRTRNARRTAARIWREHYCWPTAVERKLQLRIRQIEAGQVPRVIYLNPAIPIRLEEQLEVIVQADIKAYRRFDYVDITWITIEVAVGDTEGVLAPPNRLPVVNRKQSRRTTFGSARPN
jgi:hypothetical protein